MALSRPKHGFESRWGRQPSLSIAGGGCPAEARFAQKLPWSESAPDSVADLGLAERLAAAISDADYESKIVALLRSSFEADTAVDAGAKEVWRTALSVLRRGDHLHLGYDQRRGRKTPETVVAGLVTLQFTVRRSSTGSSSPLT